jgi:hypothetical protein
MRRNLKILTAPSYPSGSKQGSVNIATALYNDFRTKEYDPNSQLYHGRSNCRAVDPVSNARLFDQCLDYKPFKDEAY